MSEGEIIAWSYELATQRDNETGEYLGWSRRLSWDKPNTPEGSMRNLRALAAEPGSSKTRPADVQIDAAFANGVRACLRRLGHLREPDDAAWDECEAMAQNRIAERHAAAEPGESKGDDHG